ncbi:hypothetical protein ATCVMO0605SPH_015L [Acanthocystis turfacea Chlorella virus MO0605SPH]|nr:hypothetical protein ATCVMO0605SPH_015L [Acanthocystis turfacea Chlorella virus MO0605SPH]
MSFFTKINRFFKQLAACYNDLDPYRNYDTPDPHATNEKKRPMGHIIAGQYGA